MNLALEPLARDRVPPRVHHDLRRREPPYPQRGLPGVALVGEDEPLEAAVVEDVLAHAGELQLGHVVGGAADGDEDAVHGGQGLDAAGDAQVGLLHHVRVADVEALEAGPEGRREEGGAVLLARTLTLVLALVLGLGLAARGRATQQKRREELRGVDAVVELEGLALLAEVADLDVEVRPRLARRARRRDQHRAGAAQAQHSDGFGVLLEAQGKFYCSFSPQTVRQMLGKPSTYFFSFSFWRCAREIR